MIQASFTLLLEIRNTTLGWHISSHIFFIIAFIVIIHDDDGKMYKHYMLCFMTHTQKKDNEIQHRRSLALIKGITCEFT